MTGQTRAVAVFVIDLSVLVGLSSLATLDAEWKIVLQHETLMTDSPCLAEAPPDVPPQPVGEVGGGAGLQV